MTFPCSLSRRDFLSRSGLGFGALALGGLLRDAGLLTSSARGADATPLASPLNPLAPRAPHFPAKAKRVIHIFCNGGPSHVDTFDPKPALQKFAGKMLPRPNLGTERKTGAAFPSPFKFQKYGESGTEVSELFPHVAEHIDDIAVVR